MTNDDGRKPEGAPERSPKAGVGAPSVVDHRMARFIASNICIEPTKMPCTLARRTGIRPGLPIPQWRIRVQLIALAASISAMGQAAPPQQTAPFGLRTKPADDLDVGRSHVSSAAISSLIQRGRSRMRRWEFLGGLGSAAAWSLVVQAQQGDRVRRIGILIFQLKPSSWRSGEQQPRGRIS
jgi:hypothetical protein